MENEFDTLLDASPVSGYTPCQPHSASLRVTAPEPPGMAPRPVGGDAGAASPRGCRGKRLRLPCLERRGGAHANEAGASVLACPRSVLPHSFCTVSASFAEGSEGNCRVSPIHPPSAEPGRGPDFTPERTLIVCLPAFRASSGGDGMGACGRTLWPLCIWRPGDAIA